MESYVIEFNRYNMNELSDPAVNLMLNLLSGLEPSDLTEEEVEMLVEKFGDEIRKDLRPNNNEG